MKRLSTKLISSSKITTSSTSISGNFTPQFTTCSSSSASISKSPIQNLKPCSNSNALFSKPNKTHHFHKNYSTLVESSPYYVESTPYSYYVGITPFYPEQSKIEKNRLLIQEAVKAAKAAKSPEEMLEAFKKDMEDKFDKDEVGAACLNIGFELDKEGEDPQKILSFARKSLALLDNVDENKCCLPVAMALLLLGSANRSLSKVNDALGFLNRAKNILVKLEDDCKYEYGVKSVMTALYAVYMELVNVVNGMGRSKESVDYLRKSLRIKKFLIGDTRAQPGPIRRSEDPLSRERLSTNRFGNANRDFAKLCLRMKNFKDGLLYGKQADDMHWGAVDSAYDDRLLGLIYAGLEEYEKAFEKNGEAQRAFKGYGCRSDWIGSVIDGANMYIALGRYDAAVNTLKEHQKALEENSENPFILLTMGKALVHLNNFEEAKKCFSIACNVLDKEEKANPLEVTDAYIMIADQYEIMNDFETAASLLMGALPLLEKLPGEQHLVGGFLSRIGSLVLLTGKVTQATPYLERAAETSVKESYGYMHLGVGYICNKMGIAYLELQRPEAVADMVAVAKDILDLSLGPHLKESIHTCRNL